VTAPGPGQTRVGDGPAGRLGVESGGHAAREVGGSPPQQPRQRRPGRPVAGPGGRADPLVVAIGKRSARLLSSPLVAPADGQAGVSARARHQTCEEPSPESGRRGSSRTTGSVYSLRKGAFRCRLLAWEVVASDVTASLDVRGPPARGASRPPVMWRPVRDRAARRRCARPATISSAGMSARREPSPSRGGEK
jgi:hypothetical protein